MLAMKKMVSSERTTPDEEDRGNKSIKKETKDQFEQKQNLPLKIIGVGDYYQARSQLKQKIGWCSGRGCITVRKTTGFAGRLCQNPS